MRILSRAAQARPNFSGKWRLLPPPDAPPSPPALVARPDLTVTQTADTFTTEEPASGGRTVTVVYRLDGDEMRQTINRAEVVTKAAWDGEALVTTVTGPAANWRDRWTLVGARLVVETTIPGRTLSTTRTYARL